MSEVTPLTEEQFTPVDGDLVQLFISKQIDIWGWDSVQKMFDQGFEPIVVNGKVIWAK